MIETTQILQTDLLDLLFDGRNKQYGAYELRKKYSKRMSVAVSMMIACCLLFFILYAFATRGSDSHPVLKIDELTLTKVDPDVKRPEQLPPPPKTVQPPVKTVQFTTPKITEEPLKPEEQLPDKDILDDTKIGKVNQEGIDGADVISPPISDDRGVISAPTKDETDYDKTFAKVEIESDYPGGASAWQRFLNKNFKYPQEAQDNGIQGVVMVQFIVDKEGNVSDVEAISGPTDGGLREEAVRVIKKSGKWTPAVQNGRQVKSYKKQSILFRLDS
jgi:protein TonB